MQRLIDSESDASRMAAEADELVEQIRPLLAGRPREVQSAVLADLLAMWLAGHVAPVGQVADLREELLARHIELVRNLVEPNAQMILERR